MTKVKKPPIADGDTKWVPPKNASQQVKLQKKRRDAIKAACLLMMEARNELMVGIGHRRDLCRWEQRDSIIDRYAAVEPFGWANDQAMVCAGGVKLGDAMVALADSLKAQAVEALLQ